MEPFHKKEFSLHKLCCWFEEEKRNFPWRKNPTPYGVWISEVMLQQTQASVVVPYFERWMIRFPTIRDLAESSLEEVIKLWEGLGYYARARSLHEGAKYLVANHGGELPSDPVLLKKVKGLGPYTIGAILSFAFHKKTVALDGNVARVMSRLFCVEEEIDRPAIQKNLRQKVDELLPDTKSWVIMEALIELGARICSRKPKCSRCPLVEDCLAYHLGKENELPKKKKPAAVILLERNVLVIYHKKEILIQKQRGKKVMSDLYEFPYFEKGQSFESFYHEKLWFHKKMKEVSHTFTRYKAQLFPTIWEAEVRREIKGYQWIDREKLLELPFSSGHRRILKQFLEEYAYLTH